MDQLTIFDFLKDSQSLEQWDDYKKVKKLLERNGYMSEIIARTKAYDNSSLTPNSVYYYLYLEEDVQLRVIITNQEERNKIVGVPRYNSKSNAGLMQFRYYE